MRFRKSFRMVVKLSRPGPLFTHKVLFCENFCPKSGRFCTHKLRFTTNRRPGRIGHLEAYAPLLLIIIRLFRECFQPQPTLPSSRPPVIHLALSLKLKGCRAVAIIDAQRASEYQPRRRHLAMKWKSLRQHRLGMIVSQS